MRTARALLVIACLLVAPGIACDRAGPGGPDTPALEPSPAGPSAGAGIGPPQPFSFGNYPEFHDPDSGLTVIFGTPDLGVGRNRLAFAMTGPQGFINLPVLELTAYPVPATAGAPLEGPVQSVDARFHEFPYGTRGSYVTYADLDREGAWVLRVRVPRPDGTVAAVKFEATVARETKAPGIGVPAPRTASPTLAETGSLAKLTTAGEPDPALYRLSIADAVASGRPTVVAFTSPAFCTTPLCGPQVEVLSGLNTTYGERVNFIHVDLYDAPDEIKGDLSRARRSPAVKEWRLETDEWTFVIDRHGLIAGRYESFAGEPELAGLLDALLDGAALHSP